LPLSHHPCPCHLHHHCCHSQQACHQYPHWHDVVHFILIISPSSHCPLLSLPASMQSTCHVNVTLFHSLSSCCPYPRRLHRCSQRACINIMLFASFPSIFVLLPLPMPPLLSLPVSTHQHDVVCFKPFYLIALTHAANTVTPSKHALTWHHALQTLSSRCPYPCHLCCRS
jgi:hypothetical protein